MLKSFGRGLGLGAGMGIGSELAKGLMNKQKTAPAAQSAAVPAQSVGAGIACVCGVINEENRKFCSECGAKLEEAKANVCGCGAEIETGKKFCGACGKPVA
ncbi:MAG: zinc ribbon domain-containing protein [Oscillospiraceae bacterium]|nr:zinc ribbon domain-containing protein [Oscillospiraceae bacterium]